MEFKKTDPQVSGIVRKAYPNYRGRRPVRVSGKETHYIRDYWDGGSRTYARFFHIPTRRFIKPEQMDFEQQDAGNPFKLAIGKVTLTPETAVVEECIFRGKSLGIRIILHPDTYAEWESKVTNNAA